MESGGLRLFQFLSGHIDPRRAMLIAVPAISWLTAVDAGTWEEKDEAEGERGWPCVWLAPCRFVLLAQPGFVSDTTL